MPKNSIESTNSNECPNFVSNEDVKNEICELIINTRKLNRENARTIYLYKLVVFLFCFNFLITLNFMISNHMSVFDIAENFLDLFS